MTIEQANSQTYTPGPYSYVLDCDGVDDVWAIRSESQERPWIAQIRFWDEGDGVAAAAYEPDARLLAGAPELFEALDELVKIVSDPNVDIEHYDAVEALDRAVCILAKVRGR